MEIRFHAVTDGAERHKKSSRSGDPIGLCRYCTSGNADNHHSSDEKEVSAAICRTPPTPKWPWVGVQTAPQCRNFLLCSKSAIATVRESRARKAILSLHKKPSLVGEGSTVRSRSDS